MEENRTSSISVRLRLLWISWFFGVALLSSQAQQPLHLALWQQHPQPAKSRVVITNRTIIEDGVADQSYNIAPAVVEAQGTNYILTYKKGTNHVDTPWVILRYSSDSTATWGGEVTEWNSTSPDPTLAKTPMARDLLIEFDKVDSSGTSGAAYARSLDGGFTWSSFTFFDNPPDKTLVTPTLYLIDGLTMYASGYGQLADLSDDASLWVSTDDGYTWVKRSLIRQLGDAGINETTIAKIGPTSLLAISRDDAGTNTWAHFSNDMGFTWGSQVDYTSQVGLIDLPQLLRIKNVLLLFGRNPAANELVVYASFDDGQTFIDRAVLDTYTGESIDGGYCWPILRPDGTIFVVYYADTHGLRLPDIKSLVMRLRMK